MLSAQSCMADSNCATVLTVCFCLGIGYHSVVCDWWMDTCRTRAVWWRWRQLSHKQGCWWHVVSWSFTQRSADCHLSFVMLRKLKWSCQATWAIVIVKHSSIDISHKLLLLPQLSCPKFPKCCQPLTCPRTLNLVRIGCVLLDLFLKDWFFGPKSLYNIGFRPTINKWPMD